MGRSWVTDNWGSSFESPRLVYRLFDDRLIVLPVEHCDLERLEGLEAFY